MTKYILVCLLCLCALTNASAQKSDSRAERRLAVIPPDQGILVVANQQDSPLEFVNPKLLVDMHGLWKTDFKLRNRGTKPIRAYTVAAIGLNEWGWKATDSSHYIMPGQVDSLPGEEGELVPLTEELRDKLKLRGPMKGIMALTVVRVEYADGSAFEEKAYEAQKEYFEKLY